MLVNHLKTCAEIKKILDYELALGNAILDVSTAWSEIKQSIQMKKPMSSITKENFMPQLNYWESRDPHYAIESGFKCENHLEGISFPLLEL